MIRSLPPGSPIPDFEPRRYRNSSGYIRLRWRLGPGDYVECYEHRVVDDHVVAAGVQRHHRNHVRDDNRPENLETLTFAEHRHEHRAADADAVVQLYTEGFSIPQICRLLGRKDTGGTYRILASRGVAMRSSEDYRPPLDRAQISRWHAQGVRAGEMMRRTGRGRVAIYKVFEELGLPRFESRRPPRGSSS